MVRNLVCWFVLVYFKSTPYGLFKDEIWFSFKYLLAIITIFSMFHCIFFLLHFFFYNQLFAQSYCFFFCLFFCFILFFSYSYPIRSMGRCSCGVMVKTLDCGIVVKEFKLQLRSYVQFRTNTFGKGMNLLAMD